MRLQDVHVGALRIASATAGEADEFNAAVRSFLL